MHLIHGTWIPDDGQEFVQRGGLYIWVETDTPVGVAPARAKSVHPRHLETEALATFLKEKLGVNNPLSPGEFCPKFFLLPTVAGRPAPAFELLRYVDEEEPLDFELVPWAVSCYRVPDVITALSNIHFMALYAAEDFQLGADLLFWQQYAQALKGVIAKDQYIPALRYRALVGTGTAGKKARQKAVEPAWEIYPGWEFLSSAYDAALEDYAAAMPGICAAGLHSSQGPRALFDKEALLRHFSECLLADVVRETPFTAKFDQQIAGTLLYGCVHPERLALPQYVRESEREPEQALEDYKHWLAWRAKLSGSHRQAGFTLTFLLEEASAADPNNWQLHFLVAARHDPSLKLPLAEYWELSARGRAAARQPFGQDFEREFLLALGSAARIYPTIWNGLATAQPAGCQLTLEEAFAFLKESAWVLGDAGYTVIVPSWWTPQGRRRTKIRLKTARRSSKGAGSNVPGHLSLDTIISYSYELSIGGEPVTPQEWEQLVAARAPLVQFRGQWIELDRDKMQEMLEFWQAHQGESPEITLQEMLKLGAESPDDLEWEHDETLREMLARLQDKSAFAPIESPRALQATLRDYQRRGVSWLRYLENLGLHPCLADDMGLGKTIQLIACLLKERETETELGPTLIIAPTSVLGNWSKEVARFAPNLRVHIHQGSTRLKEKQAFADMCHSHDVVLTSFALARLDDKLLHGVAWHRVVVDEAQNIKNPQAAQTRAIFKLNANHRLALTGTPVENRLRDLWSIFHFLNPGYLGKEGQFRKTFELPIQKENDARQSEVLKQLIEPFILRRVKTDKKIIDDLPDKIEQKMYCTLSTEQASLYEAIVRDVEEQLKEADGIQRKGLILSTLLKLKQICNHPAQFLQDGSAFTAERSHKLQRFAEMVEEVIESGESALVFTQFTEIGAALEKYLGQKQHYNTYYLHGGTSVARRERMVSEFQDPESEPSVFILSLRAGGVGLNLTRANHVFHFDRWWNPAVEDQATDRAFRIGQRKNVFVHKFVALGTMEERIDEMIEEKKRLSSLVVGNDESWLTELDNDSFKDLIALRHSAVLE